MKLLHSLQLRIFLLTTAVLTGWAFFFYFTMMHEVNDETDDALEDYAETIIVRALAGEELPSKDNGSNNQYYLREVTAAYAASHPAISYTDAMIYLQMRGEREPARILTYIFSDDAGRHHELTVSTPTFEKADLKLAIWMWMAILYGVLLLFLLSLTTWMVHGYTRRMERAAEQQKQFIGNASHELQTPLAICRNRIEMLIDDEELSEHQLEELVRTRQTLERIGRLNKSLLLLTKIENHQFGEAHTVVFNPLLKTYLADYAEVYAHRRIHVELREEGIFEATMNEALATPLLTNLLKNAYVHNADGGSIELLVTAREVRFCNSAPSATPLDVRLVFTRFYHTPEKEESTGLGLSIVQSICQSQGLTIQYRFAEGKHCFSLQKK